jgi:hypothetical protein
MADPLKRATLLAAAVLALSAAPASAAITTSSVTSPASPSFLIYDEDAPNPVSVAGTTDSSAPATDEVDLQCFYGPNSSSHETVATGVPLDPTDGSFSIANGDLSGAQFHACILRAVPAGVVPGDPTPFTGPVLAVGHRETVKVSGGPNDGTTTDYYLYGQQLTAAADYDSFGSCGLCDHYLYDDDFDQTTYTFFGNNWFDLGDNTGSSADVRSEIRIDGADAYSPRRAASINPNAASGLPALTYGFSLNAANGNLTVTESNPIVRCPNAAYPPNAASCPSFLSTGVRAERTITQESDGHLVLFRDRYVSTDGQEHALDLLPENDQSFNQHGLTVAYRFPGESSFSTHSSGDAVSFADGAPAAVYANVEGAPDGTQSTGQGAIVFDRPASPATFTHVFSSASYFHFRQTGLVTGSCSPTFSFAYASAYLAADVADLAQDAVDRFAASPATVCAPASGPGPTPPTAAEPTGRRAAALKKCKRKKKAKARKKCRKRAKRLPV